jgi:outer membrane protein assembly factor BamB
MPLISHAAPASCSGTVFLDTNGNGTKDAGELGLGDIVVSDGEAVTKTAADGSYRLTFIPDKGQTRFVFVTRPTGYVLTTNWHIKIEPVSGGSNRMDFGLSPDPNPANVAGADFSFIAGADIQYDLVKDPAQLRYDWATMNQLAGSENLAFATWSGDLTKAGLLHNLQFLRQVQETLTYPTYNGFGAHDLLKGRNDESKGLDNYEAAIGPWAYSWDYAGIHFITFMSEIVHHSVYEIPAVLMTRQDSWLNNDLAMLDRGAKVFFVTHIPEAFGTFFDDVIDKKGLEITGILRGHIHSNYCYRSLVNKIPVLCPAPIRKTQSGVFSKMPGIISFSEGRATSRLRPLGQEKRLAIVSPAPNSILAEQESVPLIINAYNSASNITAVRYSLSQDSRPIAENMALTQSTEWTWRIDLAASSLHPGKYALWVEVSDDQNQRWDKTIQFTISSQQKSPQPILGKNWVSYFGPDNSRLSTDLPLSADLTLLWASPVGSSQRGCVWFSNPLVYDGAVYVGVWDNNIHSPQGGVAVFDALTGQRLWKLDIGSIWHSPAIYNNHLYAISTDGIVHRIDINSRQVKWTFDVYDGANWAGAQGGRLSLVPIQVADGRVFARADESDFQCIDAVTGQKLWSCPVGSLHAGAGGAAVSGGTLYFADQYKLYAKDAATGDEVWTHEFGYRQWNSGCPVVKDGVLYLAHYEGISAHHVSSGQLIWHASLDKVNYTTPVIHQGRVCFSYTDKLSCKDAGTGETLWNIDTTSHMENNKFQELINSSSHALTQDYDFAGADNGALYIINLQTGQVEKEHFLGPPIKSSAAISGNMIFIGCTDGNLYAFVAKEAPA